MPACARPGCRRSEQARLAHETRRPELGHLMAPRGRSRALAGVTPTHLSKLERGASYAVLEIIAKLASVCGRPTHAVGGAASISLSDLTSQSAKADNYRLIIVIASACRQD
jgi:hypothetical protein